jgi:glycosyltransferase involved in cell wall biosynthesis
MKVEPEPFVTVLTPVYNGEPFLSECIESVLEQNYRNFEYIIVNNCSTDRTLEIATAYAQRDSRMRIHNNDKFVPVIENHNIAFSLMSPAARYCKVVSADDWIFAECLSQLVALAEANPSVGVVNSYSLFGKRVKGVGLEYERKVVPGRVISRETLIGGPYVFGSPTSLLYRSEVVRERKNFYPNENPHSDTNAVYEVLKNHDFGFVHQVLSYNRIHGGRVSARSKISGRILIARIGILLEFGPEYLNPEEMKVQVKRLEGEYYGFVASSLSEFLKNTEFRTYQMNALLGVGTHFKYNMLCKMVVKRNLDRLMRPRSALKNWAKRKHQGIEAQQL